MSREAPVPFYEGLTGKFRGSTHLGLFDQMAEKKGPEAEELRAVLIRLSGK